MLGGVCFETVPENDGLNCWILARIQIPGQFVPLEYGQRMFAKPVDQPHTIFLFNHLADLPAIDAY